jgi:hypothetical protein
MLRSVTMAVAGAVLLCWVAACGSSSPTAASTPAPASGTTTSAAAGVNPNAPEVNPGGDIPDSTLFVPYQYGAGHYQVSVPQGWARTQQGNAVVFNDKLNSVRLDVSPATAAPTVDSVRTNEIPQIKAGARNPEVGAVQVVRRTAGDAVEIAYSADSQPDPVTGKVVRDAVLRYEFFRNGTLAIVTLSGPVGADNVDPWRKVTDSFGWTS